MERGRQLLDISWETILKVFFAGFVFYLLYLVRDVFVWFLFALVISVLLEPAINFLKWFRVPRILAVIFVYLSIFGIFGFIVYLTAPIFIFEIQQFSKFFPQYFEKISPLFKELQIEALESLENFTKALSEKLGQASRSIFGAIASFFGGISSAIFILTISFFISLEERGMKRVLALISPKRYEDYILALFEKCQAKVSSWFGARILACLFVGVVSFIVFQLFNIKYVFILSLVCGLLNFIPFLGPIVSGLILLVFIGIPDGLARAILVLISFILIQQVENNILSPILAKKFIGIPVIVVLLSLVIGGKIFGGLGAILAVPVFGILYEFFKDFLEKRKEEEAQLT